jgi:hypothetical protein
MFEKDALPAIEFHGFSTVPTFFVQGVGEVVLAEGVACVFEDRLYSGQEAVLDWEREVDWV